MRRFGRALNKKTLGTVLAVALVAGVAWAAETQTVAVPSGNSFTATAVLIPGAAGGEVVGERNENEIVLSVDFGDDGLLRVNGDVVGPYMPNATFNVTVTGRRVGTLWVCDTTVVNEQTGVTKCVQIGHPMGLKPITVTATALNVISLSCD